MKNDKWFVVVDGTPGLPNDAVGERPPIFSEDGNHLAYAVKLGDNQHVVVDGELGPAYEEVLDKGLTIRPDGTVEYLAISRQLVPLMKIDQRRVVRVRHVLSR